MSTGGRPVVLVCRTLLPAGLTELERACAVRSGGLDATRERLLELAEGTDAIVADPAVPVNEELLVAAGPGLRLVANFAVGYDNIDLEDCRAHEVVVTNTPDVLTNATAELALALTLAAARRLWDAATDLREGRWTGWDPGAYLGLELSGARFAVVGLGRIGSRYAELVRPMASEILYVATRPKPHAEEALGARRAELREALEQADVVSLHAPASPATRHLIGREELEVMSSEAVLVNTSRGPLVDADALARALREDAIGAAGLDVYEDEPHVSEALLRAPRCVLAPHIGSATTTARDGMARTVAANVLAVLHGEPPPNRVA
jgi:glyoxylate reductase